MIRRERVLTALRHEQPDRTPTDFGGTGATSTHVAGYDRLATALGLDVPSADILELGMQIAGVHPAMQDALDVDVHCVRTSPIIKPDSGPPPVEYTDEWGVRRRKPAGGHWYDQESAPLAGPITVRDILNYPWPRPDLSPTLEALRERVQLARESTDRAICLEVSGAVIHHSQYLRGFEDWFYDMAGNPELIAALMDAILDVQLPVLEHQLEVAGDLCDIVFLGDDIGAQDGLQVSPETYRNVIKPRHERVFSAVRKGAPQAFIGLHSCGSVVEVIDDLIEIGVQALNPIQTSAHGMEPRELKDRFGDRLTFWGAMDTQHTLPLGSEEEVRERIRVLGKDGGYILAGVHNLQPDVPVGNILAMYDEGHKVRPGEVVSG